MNLSLEQYRDKIEQKLLVLVQQRFFLYFVNARGTFHSSILEML